MQQLAASETKSAHGDRRFCAHPPGDRANARRLGGEIVFGILVAGEFRPVRQEDARAEDAGFRQVIPDDPRRLVPVSIGKGGGAAFPGDRGEQRDVAIEIRAEKVELHRQQDRPGDEERNRASHQHDPAKLGSQ
jgi:hypothetical protein